MQQQYHFFKLAAFLGKCVHLPDMLPILKQLVGIIRQMDESGEDTYVIKSIQYMFTVGEIGDKKAYTEAMEENIGSIEKEKVMTIADMLRQEGKEQIIKNMLVDGMSSEAISRVTGMKVEDIEKFS